MAHLCVQWSLQCQSSGQFSGRIGGPVAGSVVGPVGRPERMPVVQWAGLVEWPVNW